MKQFSRFFKDLTKYRRYLVYSVKAGLKAEVANSRISWMWWFLDPIMFMIIYTFVYVVVFQKHDVPYIPVFIFSGLTIWNFFSKTLSGSVKLVRSNKSILCRVYLPKWFLVLERMGNNLFKMMISWALVFVLMIIWRVPFTLQLFNLIPLMILFCIMCFAFATMLMHFGVFMEDLKNIVDIFMKLLFYFSGVFYDVHSRIPAPFNKIMIYCNPAAFIMQQARNVIIYQKAPNYIFCLIWLGIALLIATISVSIIYRYENSYAKVI